MDVFSHRTVQIGIFMKMKQLAFLQQIHRQIHVIKGNLIQRPQSRRAACAPGYFNQSRFSELGKNVSYDNRIHLDAGGQEITGDFVVLSKCLHTSKYMNRYGKSAGYLHTATSKYFCNSRKIRFLSLFYRVLNVASTITFLLSHPICREWCGQKNRLTIWLVIRSVITSYTISETPPLTESEPPAPLPFYFWRRRTPDCC